MRCLRLVALLAIPAQLAVGQQTPGSRGSSLTLEDAINIARQNNPQLAQTRNLVRDADATIRTAYGALMPSANASLGTSYTQGGTQYYNGVALGSSADTYSSNYQLGFNYNIAAAAAFAPRAAKANRSASEANVTSTSENLRANVTTQYIQTLEQQATAALNDTLVATAQGQLDLANAKMQVGAGTILDVRTAEVAVGQAQVAALRAHNQARIETLKLFQILGVPADADAQLTTRFTVTAAPMSLDSLISLGRRVNPDLAAKKSTQFADEMQVKMARTNYLPSLHLGTGVGGSAFGYASIDPLVTQATAQAAASVPSCLASDSLRVGAGLAARGCSGTLSPNYASGLRANNKPFKFNSSPLSFSASLSLPIFNNFQREASIEQARVTRDNASFDVRSRDLQISTDVTSAYLNLVTAEKTVDLQTKIAQQATEALAYADESYKVGAKTFLDVTTARGQYEQALVARVNAVYDYHKAFAALESAVGRPLR